jgi:hypothetical protein
MVTRAMETSPLPVIVKHPGAPQWGLGYLIEERDDKRFYEFEDGQSHSIARPFWTKLQPVDLDEAQHAALEAKIKGLRVKVSPAKKPRARATPQVTTTFDEQVVRFEALFPGGFDGEAWRSEERGVPDKKGKAFKAHAIAIAKDLLDRAALASLLERGEVGEILARVKSVHQVAGSLLHPLGDLIPFGKMPPERHRPFVEAVVDLLHGEGEFSPRFDRYVGVLAEDKLNTWPLATVLTALFAPEEHVFVKPSFYEKEAAVLAIDLGYERTPASGIYSRMQRVAREVESRLVERGHKPQDGMDVYAFIWRLTSTAKPPAVKPPKPPKPAKAPKPAPAAEPAEATVE